MAVQAALIQANNADVMDLGRLSKRPTEEFKVPEVPREHLQLAFVHKIKHHFNRDPTKSYIAASEQDEAPTKEEVLQMCKIVGMNDGLVNLKELRDWLIPVLQNVLHPPQAAERQVNWILDDLKEGTDYEGTNIDPDELARHLDDLFSQKSVKTIKTINTHFVKSNMKFDRDHMVETIGDIVDRNDAFVTLPLTLVFVIVFFFLVQAHIRVFERSSTEQALSNWINGRNPRTDCENNVDNMASFWEWLEGEEDGIFGVLGDARLSTALNKNQYWLASRNILIGDISLTVEKTDGSITESWLIKSDAGAAILAANATSDNYFAAATAGAQALKTSGWSSSDIEKIRLGFITYVDGEYMFSYTEVFIWLRITGEVRIRIATWTVSTDPYPANDPLMYVWDAIFGLMVVHMMITELKDMCASLRLGIGEFFDYWKFWNCVDWVSISAGVFIMLVWYVCVVLMTDATFTDLVDDKGNLKVDVMSLSTADIDDLTVKVKNLRLVFFTLHCGLALATLSIVLKFFKAFTSNPRLKVVTDTFSHAGQDFAHFGIIFFTLFLPFVIIGHILFGNDIPEFSSMFSSINTGVMVLMGDFEFYVDATAASPLSGVLPSGMPIAILVIWYVVYMFLVLLVLLNMMLAIIIEHYTEVTSKLKTNPDAPAIWEQCRRFMKQKKETRSFVSMEHIRRMLEDDDDPAHSEKDVTMDSLIEAFGKEGMQDKQAKWLMKFLQSAMDKKTACEEKQAEDPAVILLGAVEENRDKLESISGTLQGCIDITGNEGAKLQRDLTDLVKELSASVTRLRDDQKRIYKKLDEVTKATPGATAAKAAGSVEDVDGNAKKSMKEKKDAKEKKTKKSKDSAAVEEAVS